jgi:hypothetical protein
MSPFEKKILRKFGRRIFSLTYSNGDNPNAVTRI